MLANTGRPVYKVTSQNSLQPKWAQHKNYTCKVKTAPSLFTNDTSFFSNSVHEVYAYNKYPYGHYASTWSSDVLYSMWGPVKTIKTAVREGHFDVIERGAFEGRGRFDRTPLFNALSLYHCRMRCFHQPHLHEDYWTAFNDAIRWPVHSHVPQWDICWAWCHSLHWLFTRRSSSRQHQSIGSASSNWWNLSRL